MSQSSELGTLLGCLVCIVPFVLGTLVGGWFTRRRLMSRNLVEAFLPGWVVSLLRRY